MQKLIISLNIFQPQYNDEKLKKPVADPAVIISKYYPTTSQTKMMKMFPISQ